MKKRPFFKTGSAVALATLFGAFSAAAGPTNQFTIAVIPDTQNYCDSIGAANPQPASAQIYQHEMQYLADQKTAQNIVFATHVGDVVQHGDLYDAEWQNAKSAMDILSASGLPFGVSPGNHDYDNYSHSTGSRPLAGSVKWNQYFGPGSAYFTGKSWYGGSFNGGLDSFQTFSAGGKTFLHISLEMEASDDAIAWATSVIANHPGLPVIITTHEYLSYQNDANGKSIRLDDGYMNGAPHNTAQGVWDKFISQNDQIFLVLCGHNWSSTVNGVSNGENLRADNNAFGHPVYQVLSDFQGNTFDTSGTPGVYTGGEGWLRLMTFDTQNRTIHFKTYSTELHEYAGVADGPTFGLPASLSDFTLPIPDRVFSAWKFGVISDTQWTVADDGKNPNTAAANIIKQVDSQFIAANVKLVVAVGDMVDTGSMANDYVRALYAQDLYNAGIGFYPTRGNHEAANGTYTGASADFRHAYPQIVPGVSAGWNNSTPGDITTSLVSPGADLANNPPAAATGSPFSVGINFSAPTAANSANDSVSYAFDYNNVTFVLLDQFQSPDYYTSHIPEQQAWISSTLAGRPANTHAFAFTHKNMLGGNHKDNMFGGQVDGTDPGDCAGMDYTSLSSANQTALATKTNVINAFIGSLQANHVNYMISGHDHHHYHSIVTSPDQQSKVHQLICASDSSKFYVPGTPVSTNDLAVEQELNRIGYYIFTVDGPRVTVDYYADTTASNYKNAFNFVKRSTTGYSLNGQEFVIPEGAAYATVADTTAKAMVNGESGYLGTAMQIMDGTNSSTAANNYGKNWAKAVNTGWSPNLTGLASDVLTVWGLQEIGAGAADVVTLSLNYNTNLVTLAQSASGAFALVSKDASGNWVNTVTLNTGGTPQFVFGSWNSSYALGTYGVDTNTHMVWAVVNHQGNFAAAVAQLEQPVTLAGPANDTVVTNGYPTLAWTSVAGASGYTVSLTFPGGGTTNYNVNGTSLPLAFPLTNGVYFWIVTPNNSNGAGPVSTASSFTLNRSHGSSRWSFGIISDTQWVDNGDDGFSPNSIPAGIIKQIDQAFIRQGVSVVLSVGDTVDTGSKINLDTRAVLAQDLYNAGIGFYMVRGNHEDGWYGATGSGPEINRIFPQQLNGINNVTPADISALSLIPAQDLLNLQTPANTGSPFDLGFNFSSPTNVFNGVSKAGLTYVFDYNNVRFVLLDMFDDSSNNKNSVIPQQQSWITAMLADPARPQHAFVFTHKNLLGGQHKDNLFGTTVSSADPGDCAGVDYNTLSTANQALYTFKQQGEDALITSLATNNVHYLFGGHDHHHYDSIVKSPLGTNRVHQVILASDSNKYYVPQTPVSTNDTPISQQLNTVGYYIVTVEGAHVTVDYYAVDISGTNGFKVSSATENTITNTPTLSGNWRKVLSSGYSLNGQEFVIPEGGAYSVVADTTAKAVANGETGFLGTTVQILGGKNSSTAAATNSLTTLRPLSKAVDTGWTPAAGTFSDILTLWGLTEIGAAKTDTIVISLTYNPTGISDEQVNSGLFCLVTRDANGNWVNAVDKNVGSTKTFVNGSWNARDTLGSYGVDKTTHTAWAVINQAGDFAVAQLPPKLQITGPDAQGCMNVTWPTALLPGYHLEFNPDLGATNWVPVNGNGFFRLSK